MHLLIIGSEYTGKTTLATEISKWMIKSMGLQLVRWHNHFVVPELDGHLMIHAEGDQSKVGKTEMDLNTAADQEQILSLRPAVLEEYLRHLIWHHLHPDMFREDDALFVNHFYADAVYAPLYYGFGEPGSFSDRRARARASDAELLLHAPNIVLVLVHASAEAIKDRMKQNPRPRGILKEVDVDTVLKRFQEEYDSSLIIRKFTIDSTNSSVQEMLKDFLINMQPQFSMTDRLRLAVRREGREPSI